MVIKNKALAEELQSNPRMTRREAAEYLNLSAGTLANWAVSGLHDLPYFRCGRKVLYMKADLDNWLENRRTTTSSMKSR